jgi:hypothetical protein
LERKDGGKKGRLKEMEKEMGSKSIAKQGVVEDRKSIERV